MPQESIEAPDQVRRAMMQGRTLVGDVSPAGLHDEGSSLEKIAYQRFCTMAISRRSPAHSLK